MEAGTPQSSWDAFEDGLFGRFISKELMEEKLRVHEYEVGVYVLLPESTP